MIVRLTRGGQTFPNLVGNIIVDFTAACELLYIFPRIIKHRIEISVSDQVQNRNGMLITDSACLRQKQRGQINISCVNKEKITYSRPFADNNHQDHSGSF